MNSHGRTRQNTNAEVLIEQQVGQDTKKLFYAVEKRKIVLFMLFTLQLQKLAVLHTRPAYLQQTISSTTANPSTAQQVEQDRNGTRMQVFELSRKNKTKHEYRSFD